MLACQGLLDSLSRLDDDTKMISPEDHDLADVLNFCFPDRSENRDLQVRYSDGNIGPLPLL